MKSALLAVLAISCSVAIYDVSAVCEKKGEKYSSGENWDKEAAIQFLHDHDKAAAIKFNHAAIVSFNYQNNLTETNKQLMLISQDEQADFAKSSWENATSFAWKDFKYSNSTIYRWFKSLSVLGAAALPHDKFSELNNIVAEMQDVYSRAKVCHFNAAPGTPCDLSLEPELTEIFKDSRNSRELKHVWAKWRDGTGKLVKKDFLRYVELSNEAACLNGFDDNGDLWREIYESSTFEEDIEELWQTIKPLYEQLHAYVRRKLREQYPSENIKFEGPIPAHLLGNMWAQTWSNIMSIVHPFQEKEYVDVTETMLEKKMTAHDMFKLSESFFVSLGMPNMTSEFWARSVIEKPKDRELVCHASAWDFYDKKDFRIKMCTRINMEDLITVHHEMGHVEYYMHYAQQPVVFREGANPGFHEAIGDTIALSVATPEHLRKIGLLNNVQDDPEADIVSLLKMALDKIAFVPYGYMIDSWRWKIFDGSIKTNELNTKYWEMRLKYQGLCPPVKRSEEDLDAAAKYHVVADVEYLRYFVSYVIQFQFHKVLCDEAGYKGPLHKCDIYENADAGKLMSDMLSLGGSVAWEDALEVITKGKTRKMDATPMIEYFTPLLKWLRQANKNEYIGWKNDDPMICP